MRFSVLSVGLLALLTPLTAAWSKEDREIFRLRDEIATHVGPNVTFYDFLGVARTASQDEINKAYRKKTRSLHPDKVKQQLMAERAAASKKSGKKESKKDKSKKDKNKKAGVHVSKPPSASEVRAAVKRASDMQARLGIVAEILRGPGRERYDYFLSHGFPVWKGTGYYYNRYRPGLGTVAAGLFLFCGGAAHYLALYMAWRRQREFVERYIKFARHAAWGDNLGISGIPGVDGPGAGAGAQAAAQAPPPPPPEEDEPQRPVAMNRKQRRMQERDAKKEAAKEAGGGRRGARRGLASGAAGSGSATPTPQTAGPTGTKKRVVAENGKILVVDSLGDVYLEQEDEDGNVEELLLDPNELPRPTLKDTALYRLPAWAYRKALGRNKKDEAAEPGQDEYEEEDEKAAEVVPVATTSTTAAAAATVEDDEDDSEEPGKATPSTDSNEEFELLEKSTDSLAQAAKATGSQAQAKGGKSNKRKGKKK